MHACVHARSEGLLFSFLRSISLTVDLFVIAASNGNSVGNLIHIYFILPTFYPTTYCNVQKARYRESLYIAYKKQLFPALCVTMKLSFALTILCVGVTEVVTQSQNATFVAQEISNVSACGVCDFALVNTGKPHTLLTRTLVDLLRTNNSRSGILSPKHNIPMLKQQPCINNWRLHAGELYRRREFRWTLLHTREEMKLTSVKLSKIQAAICEHPSRITQRANQSHDYSRRNDHLCCCSATVHFAVFPRSELWLR